MACLGCEIRQDLDELFFLRFWKRIEQRENVFCEDRMKDFWGVIRR